MRVIIVSREFPAADERVGEEDLSPVVDQIHAALTTRVSPWAEPTNSRDPRDNNLILRAFLHAEAQGSFPKRVLDLEEKQKREIRLFLKSQAGPPLQVEELQPGDHIGMYGAAPLVGRVLTTPETAPGAAWNSASRMMPDGLPRYAKVHLLDQHRARTHLQRQGGGIIEDGVYLLHPKRPGVLVPLRTYHHDLLQEMQREARVVLGRLGAKRLVIETIEGVTFGGEVVSRIPFKSGGASVEASEQSHRRVTYEWGSPTYEPDNALDGCAMLQDNSGIMTLVEQRQTSDLSRYEEYSKIDTSFGVSIDVMGAVSAGFKWAQTSTYRYEVEFFPRPH